MTQIGIGNSYNESGRAGNQYLCAEPDIPTGHGDLPRPAIRLLCSRRCQRSLRELSRRVSHRCVTGHERRSGAAVSPISIQASALRTAIRTPGLTRSFPVRAPVMEQHG